MIEHDLKNILWNNISFLEQSNNKILLLSCSGKSSAEKLLDLLRKNVFKLNVLVNIEKKYSFEIEFSDTDLGIRHDTSVTKEQYPQLSWLHNQQITHITTGYRNEDGKLEPLLDFHPISGQINLN